MTDRRFGIGVIVAFVMGGLTATAIAEEPHLATALQSLDKAQSALSQTRNNKGGHPQAALALIAKAEAEIRAVAP
ncbi:hypothetical protein [Acidisoma sp. 7E03]